MKDTKWEYLQWPFDKWLPEENLTTVLNTLGQHGWELTACIDERKRTNLIFKRQIIADGQTGQSTDPKGL